MFGIHAPEELLVRFVPACLLGPVGDSGNSGLAVFPKQDVLPDAIKRLQERAPNLDPPLRLAVRLIPASRSEPEQMGQRINW